MPKALLSILKLTIAVVASALLLSACVVPPLGPGRGHPPVPAPLPLPLLP